MLLTVYKDSVGADDISSKIYGMSEFTYRVREDWGMELPEITIETDIGDLDGKKIILASTANTSKRIEFYAKEKMFDYSRRMYEYRCPHVFERLADIRAWQIPFPVMSVPFGDDWVEEAADPALVPNYLIYNRQADPAQEQYRWRRRYIQALFLLKMFIRKASGVNVADISSDSLDERESFYGSDDGRHLFSRLFLSTESVWRTGMGRYDDYLSDDFVVQDQLPTALDVMNAVCLQLGVCINIFRSDYMISEIGVSAAPADDSTLWRSDEIIDEMRRCSISASGLDAEYDYIYGTYSPLNTFIPYVWGTGENDDLEILKRQAQADADGVSGSRLVSIDLPAFLRLYRLELGGSGYQNYIRNITKGGEDELDQLLAHYMAWWSGRKAKISYQVPLTDLAMMTPRTSIDVASRKMKYERWV